MGAALRAISTPASGTGASFSITITPNDGDFVAIVIHAQSSTTSIDITPPTGWTRYGPAFIASSTLQRYNAVFGRFWHTGDPVTQTWPNPLNTSRCVIQPVYLSGVDATTPVAAFTAFNSIQTSATNAIAAFAAAANKLVLGVYAGNYASPNSYAISSNGSGLTLEASVFVPSGAENTGVSRDSLRVYSGVAGGSGIAAHNHVTTGTAAAQTGYLFAFTDAAPAGTGLRIGLGNGSTVNSVWFKIVNASNQLVVPGAYKTVKPGNTTVTSMLAKTGFTIAHRGGSADYPEMSLYAYGQAALLGYGALELSLSRTSDGVWFGLHDDSLDRTSDGTGGGSGTTYIANNLTWAQVQTHNIRGAAAVNNPSQANRPYMRLEEILAKYYPSHVLFIDIKSDFGDREELLGILDALPSTPQNHIVCKGFGQQNLWPQAAHAHGYQTWGYFYEASVGAIPTYLSNWDILGQDYTASSGTWTTTLSYGKPVIAHTIATAANASTALGLGAKGLMVSGVKLVTPV